MLGWEKIKICRIFVVKPSPKMDISPANVQSKQTKRGLK